MLLHKLIYSEVHNTSQAVFRVLVHVGGVYNWWNPYVYQQNVTNTFSMRLCVLILNIKFKFDSEKYSWTNSAFTDSCALKVDIRTDHNRNKETWWCIMSRGYGCIILVLWVSTQCSTGLKYANPRHIFSDSTCLAINSLEEYKIAIQQFSITPYAEI